MARIKVTRCGLLGRTAGRTLTLGGSGEGRLAAAGRVSDNFQHVLRI